MPTTDIEVCPHDVHHGTSSTLDHDESPKHDQHHAGLRRVAGPIPWLLFLICVVEVRTTKTPLSLKPKLTNFTTFSLENDSYILECPLHSRITFSKDRKLQTVGRDLTSVQASLPIRSRYWYSWRPEQRSSGRIGLGQHAQVLVIPLHRVWCDCCWYRRNVPEPRRQGLTKYDRSVVGKVQDDPSILTSLHSRHDLARRYCHTYSNKLRCIFWWPHR
jgi:hypothetical protein